MNNKIIIKKRTLCLYLKFMCKWILSTSIKGTWSSPIQSKTSGTAIIDIWCWVAGQRSEWGLHSHSNQTGQWEFPENGVKLYVLSYQGPPHPPAAIPNFSKHIPFQSLHSSPFMWDPRGWIRAQWQGHSPSARWTQQRLGAGVAGAGGREVSLHLWN
jgi:hypothetical protein